MIRPSAMSARSMWRRSSECLIRGAAPKTPQRDFIPLGFPMIHAGFFESINRSKWRALPSKPPAQGHSSLRTPMPSAIMPTVLFQSDGFMRAIRLTVMMRSCADRPALRAGYTDCKRHGRTPKRSPCLLQSAGICDARSAAYFLPLFCIAAAKQALSPKRADRPETCFGEKMIFKGRGTKTPQVFWGKSFYKKSSVSFR